MHVNQATIFKQRDETKSTCQCHQHEDVLRTISVMIDECTLRMFSATRLVWYVYSWVGGGGEGRGTYSQTHGRCTTSI